MITIGGGDQSGTGTGTTTEYESGSVTEVTNVAVVSDSSPATVEREVASAVGTAARPHVAVAERDPYDPNFCAFGNGVFNPVPTLTEGPMLTAGEIRAYGLDLTSTYRHVTYTCYGTERDVEYPAIIRVGTGPGVDQLLTQVTGSVITAVNPPDVTLSPPDRGVVNLPTWLRVENWSAIDHTATIGAATVRVVATPVGSEWKMGEDDDPGTVACDGPGEAWDPDAGVDPMSESSCSYTFRYPSSWDRSEVFEIEATVIWTFGWSLNGVEQGDLLTFRRTTVLEYGVDEIQTVGGAG